MATREQLIEDFADHKYATGERFARLINSMKVVQEPVADPAASGTSLSFIDSIEQDADGKITATKKTLDLANAHELNPFKGWWKTGDTLPTSGFDGAYLYFKDTTQTPAVTTIYRWNGTAYADTGTEVDESNVQTFGSGQQVNAVKIKDKNGEEVTGDADVLSAEAGAKLSEKTDAIGTEIELSSSIESKGLADADWNGGYYINTNGTRTPSADWRVYRFTPESYNAVTATLNGEAGKLAIAFYSSDLLSGDADYVEANLISSVQFDADGDKVYSANIPEGCLAIIVSCDLSELAVPTISIHKTVYSSCVPQLKSEMSKVVDEIGLEQLSDLSLADFTHFGHAYLHLNGRYENNANWDCYTLANNGYQRVIVHVGSNTTAALAIAFYSQNSIPSADAPSTGLIDSVATINGDSEYAMDVPDGCVLIAVANRTASYASPTAAVKRGYGSTVLTNFESRIETLEGRPVIPAGGVSGDVLTPDGWEALTALLSGYVTNAQLVSRLASYVTTIAMNSALSEYQKQSSIASTLAQYMQKSDYTSNINAGAVTVSMLSQSVLDLIAAGGGSAITNNPDDIDIEANANNQLQLKGGGVVRFRVKASGTENVTELARCKATGLPIQVENAIDFINADNSLPTIDLDGCVIVFVGNGLFKNCEVTGSVEIRAGRNKVFDNVYFHQWYIGGVSTNCYNKDSLYNMYLANTDYDVYNRLTKVLSPSVADMACNPFFTALTVYKSGSFLMPILDGTKYIYSEDGGTTALLTFEVEEGNIKVPIRKDYLFLDGNGDVVESTYDIKTKTATYAYVAPADLQISRLLFPTLERTGKIISDIFPEWFGAVSNDNSGDCKDGIQYSMLCGGSIDFASNSTYWCSGNVRVYSDTELLGHSSVIKMTGNSPSYCMFELETLASTQKNIVIFNLTLDGNKANNVGVVQDGLYADFGKGLQPFNGYSVDDTYWYNFNVLKFRGSGICVAVPGTSHIYSSRMADNSKDGITWDNEHFTLTNVTCWNNVRHGVYASGNHWRIIGGAFAHNLSGDNIHCEGAFESQIIGCSCIHSGQFVEQAGGGYVASSLNPYGYIWAGEGQGTHALIGGNGIHLKSCYNMTMIGIRVNNQNANGVLIDGGNRITISNSQFNANNMTKGEFSDINSNIELLYIDNSYYNSNYCVTNQSAINFGNSNGQVDWNDLKTDLKGFGQGVFNVNDYYSAQNRPAGAGSYLQGTIVVKNGISNTVGRTYIRLMDENCNIFVRYCNINYSNGIYTNDSGWKKVVPV